jgi:hypothetical protein
MVLSLTFDHAYVDGAPAQLSSSTWSSLSPADAAPVRRRPGSIAIGSRRGASARAKTPARRYPRARSPRGNHPSMTCSEASRVMMAEAARRPPGESEDR